MCKKVTDNIYYVGVKDLDIDLFEGQYEVPEGMLYNSYVFVDSRIAVFDTVDKNFKDEWFDNLNKVLNGRLPEYLIVQHMEPDHSANIYEFMRKYPDCKIVATAMAFNMMKAYFGTDFEDRKVVAKEGDTLSLGTKTLKFVMAPNCHWPEVMFTLDVEDGVLFSADAFGKFGATLELDDWACEARRYYFGIVGKFGDAVQKVLQKLIGVELTKILPLHGPMLENNLGYYINKYNVWSKYEPEDEGVTICYTSVYGNTLGFVSKLKIELEKAGLEVSLFDLARDDMAEAVEDAFRYSKIVLATQTYAGGIFPFMQTFINTLVEHNYQNRKVALVEAGMWAPMAAKVMKTMLEPCKNLTICENTVTIKGSVSLKNLEEMQALVNELK